MSVIDDPIDRYCTDCGRMHMEEDMNCCNECEGWTCVPFTLDPHNEVCNGCYPGYHAELEQKAREDGPSMKNEEGVHA